MIIPILECNNIITFLEVQGKEIVDSIGLVSDKGHSVAFTNLYIQYFKRLIIESNKYIKDIHVAEEIVQDVFLKLWEKSEELGQIKTIKSYLYRSVVNSSINHLNRQKNLEQHHQKILSDFTEEYIQEIDEENELILILSDEIEKLPPKCKEIFKLSRFEKLKYKEIGIRLDISERTVENHVANALRILREAMLSPKRGISINKQHRLLTMFF